MGEIKPALTPEEWARGWEEREYEYGNASLLDGEVRLDTDSWWEVVVQDRHATAALCLYDQPFGFTWEDADECRAIAHEWEARYDNGGELSDSETAQRWHHRADRIESLLPPRLDTSEPDG